MTPLKYVVLHHYNIDEPHYDLMFETYPGSQLATWRSPIWPIDAITPVTRLKDHRRFYLTFEGEIQGQRGYVTQMAAGQCTVEVGEDAVWTIRFDGTAVPRVLTLRQINDENWEALAD